MPVPSRNVRVSWIFFGRYTATGIITRQKRIFRLHLLSLGKELVHYFVKNFRLMKREIKFKAKSIYNGEWVNGDLLHQADGTHIFMGKGENGHTLCPRVDPSTVCRFTGLKDCDGNEVWEGDIIKSPYFVKLAIVKWDDSLCGFKCVGVTDNIYYSLSSLVVFARWYVVGNKFDKE